MLEDEVRIRVESLIDPETNRTLGELNMIMKIELKDGNVEVAFTPNSPFSPLAYSLATMIKKTASEVPGVKKVKVICDGHMMDELVNRLVNKD